MKRVVIVVCLVAVSVQAAPTTLLNAVNALGGRLVANQKMDGRAVWVGENGYEGATALGLVSAFDLTKNAQYQVAAVNAGWRIATDMDIRDYDAYYGDDVLLFARLGDKPIGFSGVAGGFFAKVRQIGTETYIADYLDPKVMDASVAVFYLAHYTVAANALKDRDMALWRSALIVALSRVDDKSLFPVMAMGVGTWALAQTGPMNSVLIDPAGKGAALWKGKRLQDLPGMLLSHQVPAGELYAGSFYSRFDHTGGVEGYVNKGYTEDAIYGTMGLAADKKVDPNAPAVAADALLAARSVLMAGIGDDGAVKDHLVLGGTSRFVYSGEMLGVLGMLATADDLK